jgi:hypothetical protein
MAQRDLSGIAAAVISVSSVVGATSTFLALQYSGPWLWLIRSLGMGTLLLVLVSLGSAVLGLVAWAHAPEGADMTTSLSARRARNRLNISLGLTVLSIALMVASAFLAVLNSPTGTTYWDCNVTYKSEKSADMECREVKNSPSPDFPEIPAAGSTKS